MQISPISFINFQKKYDKDDVLRLITGYDYKNSGHISKMMKELTGVDYSSDEVKEIVSDRPYCELSLYNGVKEQCRRKVFANYPELLEADEAFEVHAINCPADSKALDIWFKAQLFQMRDKYDIEPFRFSPKRLQKDNDKFMDNVIKKLDTIL